MTVQELFRQHQLRIYDVERLLTHGGSLRVYACHASSHRYQDSSSVETYIQEEKEYGLNTPGPFIVFQEKVDAITQGFLRFLLEQKQEGKVVVGYGAAAKGNTLLNACGIKGTDLIRYVVDASPHKQGFFLPGSHIPICHPGRMKEDKPNIVVIFPWNIAEEIMDELKEIYKYNGKLYVPLLNKYI